MNSTDNLLAPVPTRRDLPLDLIPGQPGESANHLDRFIAELDTLGLHAALRYLNSRTRFRFTGLYQAAAPLLIVRSLFDRENPSLDHCGETKSVNGTFCSIVIATGRPFTTHHAPTDSNTEGYPARREVMSYCGVPIRLESGHVAGVLCHYDLRLRLPPAEEPKILGSVAARLARYVSVNSD